MVLVEVTEQLEDMSSFVMIVASRVTGNRSKLSIVVAISLVTAIFQVSFLRFRGPGGGYCYRRVGNDDATTVEALLLI